MEQLVAKTGRPCVAADPIAADPIAAVIVAQRGCGPGCLGFDEPASPATRLEIEVIRSMPAKD